MAPGGSRSISLAQGSDRAMRRWYPRGLSLATLALLVAFLCLCPVEPKRSITVMRVHFGCDQDGFCAYPCDPNRRYEATADGSSGNKLRIMKQKREAAVPSKADVSVSENKAKEFFNSPKRQKRQLWDRNQPDVQQWYQHFLYLGFDEAKYEDDMSYWKNMGRAGSEYYGGYQQHHYDEDAAIGPRNPHTFRHGASVNYDDY